MNITRENIDNVNAVINIAIEKADYAKQVEDVLKDYRQKASIPGFRPGKAPKGLIQKKIWYSRTGGRSKQVAFTKPFKISGR